MPLVKGIGDPPYENLRCGVFMNASLCCLELGRAKTSGIKEQLHFGAEPVSSTGSNGGFIIAAVAALGSQTAVTRR